MTDNKEVSTLEKSVETKPEKKTNWQMIISLILLGIVLAFALVNTQNVTVNFLFKRQEVPLILVILLSMLLGALISWFAGWRQRTKRKKKNK